MTIAVEEATAPRVGNAGGHPAEGAVHDATSDTVWWFDVWENHVLENHLYEADLRTGGGRRHSPSVMVGIPAFIDDSRQSTAAANGLHERAMTDATPTPAPAPSGGQPVGTVEALPVHGGAEEFDGASVDADGRIRCGACLHAHPPEGDLVRRAATPVRRSTSLMFVDSDVGGVPMTPAHDDVDEGRDATMRAAGPHHGHTVLFDVGAIGRSVPRVRLETG